eukprot:Hpha_TRINITY_DN15933_c2_g1::TRINITY_DN15933_c2_g1_i1::g.72921::m.72921
MVKFGEQLQNHRWAFGDVVPVNRYVDYESLKQLIYAGDAGRFLKAFLGEVAKVFRACLSVCLELDQNPQCSRCAARTVRVPQRKMQALTEYVRINREGCRKILKKFDKNTGSQVLSEYMTIVDALLQSAQCEVDQYLLRSLAAQGRPRSSSCPPAPRESQAEFQAPAGGPSPQAYPLDAVEDVEKISPSAGPSAAAEWPPHSTLPHPAVPIHPPNACSTPPPLSGIPPLPSMHTLDQRLRDSLGATDVRIWGGGGSLHPPPFGFNQGVTDSPGNSPTTGFGGVGDSPVQGPTHNGASFAPSSSGEMIVWEVIPNGRFEGVSVGVVARSACVRRTPGGGRGTTVSVSQSGGPSVQCEESLVFDPENKARYLVGPGMIESSAGFEDFGKKAKSFLCMLFQKGHCRAGHSCNQLHVDRTAVATLRQVAAKGRSFSAQSNRHFVTELRNIRDPTTQQLIVIPFCKTEESAGREAYGRRRGEGEWTLCTKHLDGTCAKGSACGDIHVEPSHVVRVREGDACCPAHAPERADTAPGGQLLRVRLSGRHSDNQTIAPEAVCLTKGLQRLPQQPDGSRHFPIGKVCRLHQENRCDYGRNCNNVHLCRQLYARYRSAKPEVERGDKRGTEQGGVTPMFYPHQLLQQGLMPVMHHPAMAGMGGVAGMGAVAGMNMWAAGGL